MNVAEFDQWRERYAGLTYEAQQRFYDRMEQDHPAQFSYRLNLPDWHRFFAYITGKLGAPRVLELGGWHGEQAAEMLAAYPTLATWVNIEICPAAIEKSACNDPRYKAYCPPDFAWNVRLPDADVFLACHVLEHITVREFGRLLDNLPAVVSYAAIEMPIPDEGPAEWQGYHGSHIYEAGWKETIEALARRGWKEVSELRHNELRVFTR